MATSRNVCGMEQHPEPHSSKPTHPTVSSRREALQDVLDDERTLAALDYRVARYAERSRLTPDGTADLSQDLWLELVLAFERYDPARSSPGVFARRVADLWLKQRARADFARSQRMRRARRGYVDRAFASVSQDHNAIDVQVILDSIPDDSDAELLSSYRHWSVTELAASRGLNRSATHRRLKVLSKRVRRRFPGMAREFSDSRATPQDPAAER